MDNLRLTSIAETTNRNIIYSLKHFSEYLTNESGSTIFLQPINKRTNSYIISSLTFCKGSRQERVIFVLKKYISRQLADLFNLSFMTGVFLTVLETEKVVTVFKKD